MFIRIVGINTDNQQPHVHSLKYFKWQLVDGGFAGNVLDTRLSSKHSMLHLVDNADNHVFVNHDNSVFPVRKKEDFIHTQPHGGFDDALLKLEHFPVSEQMKFKLKFATRDGLRA